jgi:hypothetical protein
MDTKKAPIQADTRKSTSLLKKYLLETYGIKTSVRSEFYSMGCSLNISYTLGPDSGVIESVCKKLEYGRFDGMTDYSYSVEVDGLVVDGYKLEEFKHVFVRQECSNEFEVKLCQFAFSKIKFGDLLPPTDWSDYCAYKPEVFGYSQGSNSLSNLFYRYFRVWNFATQDENKINLLECHFSEQTNGTIYFIYECDGVVYNTEEVPTIGQKESKSNEAPEYEKMEVKAGEVQIIDYSDKAIAVIGDTKSIKDKLKELGGRFNFRLSCGPGWIFKKSDLQKIQKALNGGNDPEPTEPEPDNTPEPPTKTEYFETPAEVTQKLLMPPVAPVPVVEVAPVQQKETFRIETTNKGVIYTLKSVPDGNYKGKIMQIAYFGTWSDGKSDRLSIRYGKKLNWKGLFWTGAGDGKVYLQTLHEGKYGDIKMSCVQFADILKAIGANNELQNFNSAVEAWNSKSEDSEPEEPKTTLKDEIAETVHFFEATDLKIYGEVLESTKQIAEVQKVELKSENVSFAPPQLNLSASTPQQIQLILF